MTDEYTFADDALPGAGYGAIEFFRYDPALYNFARKLLRRTSMALLSKYGQRATEMPRSAAIAHEVGHVIVGAHDRRPIQSVRIFKYKGADNVWCGTTDSIEFVCSIETPVSDDLDHARYLIGGLAGEALLDPPAREGSSLDEVIASQVMVHIVATKKLARPDGGMPMWMECFHRARAIIEANRQIADKLSTILRRERRIDQPKLGELLGEIRRLDA